MASRFSGVVGKEGQRSGVRGQGSGEEFSRRVHAGQGFTALHPLAKLPPDSLRSAIVAGRMHPPPMATPTEVRHAGA